MREPFLTSREWKHARSHSTDDGWHLDVKLGGWKFIFPKPQHLSAPQRPQSFSSELSFHLVKGYKCSVCLKTFGVGTLALNPSAPLCSFTNKLKRCFKQIGASHRDKHGTLTSTGFGMFPWKNMLPGISISREKASTPAPGWIQPDVSRSGTSKRKSPKENKPNALNVYKSLPSLTSPTTQRFAISQNNHPSAESLLSTHPAFCPWRLQHPAASCSQRTPHRQPFFKDRLTDLLTGMCMCTGIHLPGAHQHRYLHKLAHSLDKKWTWQGKEGKATSESSHRCNNSSMGGERNDEIWKTLLLLPVRLGFCDTGDADPTALLESNS